VGRKQSDVPSIHHRLLDIAIDRFGRKGIEGASTRCIASLAGTNMSARATLLRVTGWTDVDNGGVTQIRRTIRAHSIAILTNAKGDVAT
jgi:hypothetical protein